MSRDWDGKTYDRVSAEMERLGEEVLGRLDLSSAETCLDAGCGSGRVTEKLAGRVDRVYAVDADPSMVKVARERLDPLGNVVVTQGDLLDFDLPEPVGAVLSTAVFHWIDDHPRLFASLRSHLLDGGRLEAQCGGRGNIAGVMAAADRVGSRAPYAEYLAGYEEPKRNFADPAETQELLREVGFSEARCWLEEREVRPDEPAAFLKSVNMAPRIERLPEPLGDRFAEELAAEIAGPLDYVRLNISATA